LWNILYDGLLHLRLLASARFFAFAENVAIIIRAKDTAELGTTLGIQQKTADWLRAAGFHLALQNSETLFITNKRCLNQMDIFVDGTHISVGSDLKYLGIQLNSKLNLTAHSRLVAEKASKAVQNLMKIIPNVSATKENKRKLILNVVHSLLLHGASLWADKMSRKGWSELEKVQRRIALRVASVYQTTSKDAVLVIAGITPLELLAEGRKTIYEHRADTDLNNFRQVTYDNTVTAWQEVWDRSLKGEWTHTLINQIKPWISRKHGSIDYSLTQALTGHRCHSKYLHKIGKLETPECRFCQHPMDDPFHTFFVCDAWGTRRFRAEIEVDTTLTPEFIIEVMLKDARSWNAVNRFVHEVFQKKMDEERKR